MRRTTRTIWTVRDSTGLLSSLWMSDQEKGNAMQENDDATEVEAEAHNLTWDGDNRAFICSWVIPNLKLSAGDKKVLCEAYGCGGGKSWEMESDGETVVADMFMGGRIKSPAGVAHDYINRVPCHRTLDGRKWSVWQSNALYLRIQRAQGAPFRLRWRRWLGLTLSIPFWWQ